jgi:F-type H+-transporting ATPase subunit delta
MIGRMTTLARPYALAAFECAREKKTLPVWDALLTTAAEVAQDPVVTRLLASPDTTSTKLAKFFCDVLTKMLDSEKSNFIHLLAERKRLALLPEIAELFKSYRATFEKTLNVTVITATAMDEKMKNKIRENLTKRLKQQISIECETDSSLMGGVVIRAGDKVIDSSVQSQLKRLLDSLSR